MKEISVTLINATVTQVNKYNQNSGFVISFFFFSTLYTDVVFRLEKTGEDYPHTIRNLNFSLFSGQKVQLITVDDTVVGYIDRSSGNYHFFTNNLQRDLKHGLIFNWPVVLILTLLIFFLAENMFGNQTEYIYLIFAAPAFLRIYQLITNFQLEQKISKQVEAASYH